MHVPVWRSLAVVPIVVCLGVAAGAASPPDRPERGNAAHAIGTRVTAIRGAAWAADNSPIKQANVRLRNVVTGRIEASAIANDAGQFAFDNVPSGSYVVELLNASGKVEVVGNAFTIATGETVATFVRTAVKAPWYSGFFGSTLAAVASTAASEGVTAIAPLARPVSAKQ